MELLKQADYKRADQLEDLQQLTLVIPTYNRPHFLARLLNYYAEKNTQIHFLILDSSDEQAKILNQQAVNLLGDRARKIDFPSSIAPAQKIFEGLKLVDTPFCACCADDDLVFVDGLTQALSFLKENSAYVCVDGIYLNFNTAGDNINVGVEYATKGINAEDPGARVFRLYQKYESIFYGVFRTRDTLNIFSGLCKNTSFHYQELFQATAALLLGKSHRLPIFYAARQQCEPAEPNREKWQTYYWFADNPKELFDHYLVYRDELWNFYHCHVSDKKHDKETFLKIMDIAHAMYFSTGCPPVYFHSVLQQVWPKDGFQTPSYQDNVCNQLKGSGRVWLESKLEKLLKRLPRQAPAFYWLGSVTKFNRKIRRKANYQWNCMLNRKERWLVKVVAFQNAYLELCKYMG